MRKLINDKRGVTLSGWTEGIIFSLIFVLALVVVMVEMNNKYSKNYDPSFGMAVNTTYSNLAGYQGDLANLTNEGISSTTGQFSLSSSWQLIKTGANIIWSFLTGGWIEQACVNIGLPAFVAILLRMLYFVSIGYALVKIIMRVKP